MFGNMKNLAQLMGSAGQIKEKMEEMQRELPKKTVEGEAGGGAVRVTVNGKMDVVKLEFDKAMLSALIGTDVTDENHTMTQELIRSAMNDALEKARELVKNEIAAATGGLDIPGIEKMFG